LFEIKCKHMETGEVKIVTFDKISEVISDYEPICEIPEPKFLEINNSLDYNFLPLKLFDKLNFHIHILVPIDNDEDFFFQYVDNDDFSNVVKNKGSYLGCKFSDVYRNLKDLGILGILQNVYEDGKTRETQIKVYKDNHLIFYLESVFVMYADKIYNFSQPKTDDYLNSIQLEKTVSDNERLLKELQDRVRNNLQLIRSFIDLEIMNNPGSPEMTLKKTSARISALSIVHQEIYNSDNPLYLSNANFIEIILTNLLNDFQSSNISLDLDFAKVIYVGMDQAILLSLIVNELCTNTINHAYPNGETGILHVKLYNDDSDSIVLEFFDEGVGLPSDVDVGSFDNLGFTIVKSLVGQLNGNVNVMDLDKGFGLFIKF